MTMMDILKMVNNHADKNGLHRRVHLRELEDGLNMPASYMGTALINYMIDLYEEKQALYWKLAEKERELEKLKDELHKLVNRREAQMIKVKAGVAKMNPKKKGINLIKLAEDLEIGLSDKEIMEKYAISRSTLYRRKMEVKQQIEEGGFEIFAELRKRFGFSDLPNAYPRVRDTLDDIVQRKFEREYLYKMEQMAKQRRERRENDR